MDTLRLLDLCLWGMRLTVLLSRCPRRPLLSVVIERCPRGAWGTWWVWERENGW